MLDRLVNYAKTRKLSDLHIHADKPLAIRTHGIIERISEDVVSRKEIEDFFNNHLDVEQKDFSAKNKQVDFAVAADGIRFRVNGYLASHGPSMVMRKIETNIPAIESLGLPKAMMD